jgi:hypothetical protein
MVCDVVLQDSCLKLAALLAESAAATAAASAQLKEVAAEADHVKTKLLTERASNKRHMELSAQVWGTCLTEQQRAMQAC